jgi:hypothetical protein
MSVQIYDQKPRAHDATNVLTIDWSHHFETQRQPAEGAVEGAILPALADIAASIEAVSGLADRSIRLAGNLSLPLAVAVGVEFRAVRRFRLTWSQHIPGGDAQDWGLNIAREDSGISAKIIGGAVGAKDVAVLVSISRNVINDFDSVRPTLPRLRAIAHLGAFESGDSAKSIMLNPAQASDAVAQIVEAIRHLRETYAAQGSIHLFLAAPAGIGIMLGQCLNTLGQVVVYQYDPISAPVYRPMVTLVPSH